MNSKTFTVGVGSFLGHNMADMRFFALIFAIFILPHAPVFAQVPLQELTSPNKKLSCSDKVTPDSAIKGSELAFTGRVLKRDQNFTWFRIHIVHSGDKKGGIVKAGGFYGGKQFAAGSGQSYDVDEYYTVVLRKPQTEQEKVLGVDYMNALDSCGESVVSKAHDRYGPYRVKPEQLTPGGMEGLKNSFYFHKGKLFFLIILAGAGAAYVTQREKIDALIGRFTAKTNS